MEKQFKVQKNYVVYGGIPDQFAWKDWVKGTYNECRAAILDAGGKEEYRNWSSKTDSMGCYDMFRIMRLDSHSEYEGMETIPDFVKGTPDFVKDGVDVEARVVQDPSAVELHPRTMQTYMHPRAVSDLLFQFDALRKSNELKTVSIENLHTRLNARNNECAEIREKLFVTMQRLSNAIRPEAQTHGFDTRWACLKCQSSDVAVHVAPNEWDVKFFMDCSSCEEVTMRELSLTNE